MVRKYHEKYYSIVSIFSIEMVYKLKYNDLNIKTLGQGRVNLSVFSKRVEEW